jgi:hypothetical protein
MGEVGECGTRNSSKGDAEYGVRNARLLRLFRTPHSEFRIS